MVQVSLFSCYQRYTVHKRCHRQPYPKTHDLFLSGILFYDMPIILSLRKTVKNLINTKSSRDFRHHYKKKSNNHCFQLSLFCFIQMVPLLPPLYPKLNSLLIIKPWTILGSTPPSTLLSAQIIPDIEILPYDIFYTLSVPDPRKAYGPDRYSPIFLKTFASEPTPFVLKLFLLMGMRDGDGVVNGDDGDGEWQLVIGSNAVRRWSLVGWWVVMR